MQQQEAISTDYKYPSQFAQVDGSRIHYVEQGAGDPIVFLHGMPTYSYLWRNIIPYLSNNARCIAPDFIGMGLSDKPDIEYRIFDHIRYMDKFFDELKLDKVTLVMHGWGSLVGFDWARRHVDRVKALCFFESYIRPNTHWEMLSLPVQELDHLSKSRDAYNAIIRENYLVDEWLPSAVTRRLKAAEKKAYAKPFPTEASRKPLLQFVRDLPLGKGPDDVVALIQAYSDWLKETSIPKLMMYAVPGFITTIDTVKWAKDNLKNLTLIDLHDVLHFAQESTPDTFGQNLKDWYLKKVST